MKRSRVHLVAYEDGLVNLDWPDKDPLVTTVQMTVELKNTITGESNIYSLAHLLSMANEKFLHHR